MEEIRIAEAHVTESGITVENMDSEVDSFTLKSSSLEENADSKCNRLKALKSVSKLGEQNHLDSGSFMSPLVKESNGIRLNNGGGESCPITPSPDGETVEISSASDQTNEPEILSDCETPIGSLFNPFAPGPEEFALAPKKKMMREFKIPIRRQLNFDICCDFEEKVESVISCEEDDILESVCKSFLELIVSNQLKEICSEDLVEEDMSSDDTSVGFKTPTSMPLLTGIAETCPDAPMRPSFKSRKMDQNICRKLEFESYLI